MQTAANPTSPSSPGAPQAPDLRGLSAEHLAVMKEVGRRGADVFCRHKAQLLREVERLQPAFIRIGKTPNEYGPRQEHPKFGAQLTETGARFLRANIGHSFPAPANRISEGS